MTEPRRVVVRAPNWLGDLVMAAPSIGAVARAWPHAVVDVAVPAAFAPLVPMLHPRVGVLPLEGGRVGLRVVQQHAAQLRAGEYDIALLLTNSFGTALACKWANIGERWGYRRDARGWLLTRAVRQGKVLRQSRHHADYYAALIDALGFPRPALKVHGQLPDAVRAATLALLRERGWDGEVPLLACAPGAAYGTAKQWSPTHVGRVATWWVSEGGAVVLVGSIADRGAADAVLEAVDVDAAQTGRVIDLTGRTNLQAFAGVLAVAHHVLSNDSGAMHVAAAFGTPTVAVFGPTIEESTAPLGPHRILTHDVWCRPCMLRECPLDHRCMTGVSPSRVMEALGSPKLPPPTWTFQPRDEGR